jgi:hypothetical protein
MVTPRTPEAVSAVLAMGSGVSGRNQLSTTSAAEGKEFHVEEWLSPVISYERQAPRSSDATCMKKSISTLYLDIVASSCETLAAKEALREERFEGQ